MTWQIVSGAILLAVLFTLVRPGSPGSQAVKDTSDALASMVRAATGYKWTDPATNQAQ